MSNGVESCNGDLVQLSNDVKENDNPGLEILQDLDSCWKEINDRLTVSRVVSDSVIKGIVDAVRQEAAEKIAQKELEVTKLKEMLHVSRVGGDENEFLPRERESKGTEDRVIKKGAIGGVCPNFLEAVVEHDGMEKSLGILRGATKEQFNKLKNEVDRMRGCSSIKTIGSDSQLLGLGDKLQDNASDRWIDVARSFDSLKGTVETVFQQVEEMVSSAKASVCEWQQEQDFKAEIEALVMRNCIWSIEEKNRDRFYGNKNLNWHGRMEEISSLREELDTISKSLSVSDIGHLSSHGSLEVDEGSKDYKKGDRSHHKVLNNLKSSPSLSLMSSSTSTSTSTSTSSSLSEENGKHDESERSMQERLDVNRVTRMSTDELKSYLTKLKRSHESEVQDLTEQIFSLRREFFRERGSSLPSKKSKEFDMLRRRISEVITKLDEVLVEKEEVATCGNNEESLSSLKERLELLISENHHLRDLLANKEREVKCQVSEAAEKTSEHSMAEAKLSKTNANLKSAVEDADIEALIVEDTYACILRGMMDQIKCIAEESHVENIYIQEIYKSILKKASHSAQTASQSEIEDLSMEYTIMQEHFVLVFKEAMKDAEQNLKNLNMKYREENELRVSLEMEKLEIEKQCEVEVANRERLKTEITFLSEEKEQLAQDATAALEIERERYESAAQELHNLKDETCRLQKLISDSIEESNAIKQHLTEALEQNERYKADVWEQDQKLELTMKNLCEERRMLLDANEEKKKVFSLFELTKKEFCEERRMLLDANQEKRNAFSLLEAKERVHKQQLESMAVHIRELWKAVAEFENRVTQDISGKCSRLRNLSYQLCFLKQKANVIVKRGLLYEKRLEKKCSELEKAEAEVDLLGDKVDTLLSLVEKIHIALDHYSPVLKHYPGITEILKLLRRELTGETKAA
ncbi:WPP domain-associated protein-like [Pyrus communis]|uniref:WPP domain-associated protein-like n=1 Tax=Pyrus communis TaxID=23211 RepID=UPI0035BEE8B0